MSQLSISTSHDRLQLFDSDVSQTFQEFRDELEREKIELSQAVKDYIAQHVRILEEKMSKGEGVTEDDMKFIDEVRMWVAMPEEWRGKLNSIEKLMASGEIAEANKRHISLQQWFDLLHMAEVSELPREWIGEQFRFPGDGKIESEEDVQLDNTSLSRLPENLKVARSLFLNDCRSLTHLPEHLEADALHLSGCTSLVDIPASLKVFWLNVNHCSALTHLPGDLKGVRDLDLEGCESLTSLPENLQLEQLNLRGCTSLTQLPSHLTVENKLNLTGCTGLTHLPDNWKLKGNLMLSNCTSLIRLPENLSVWDLNLRNCSALTFLPENLKVGGSLELRGCTSLTHLPDSLYVEKVLSLPRHNLSLKADAERLKKEGKIKGEIRYY